MAYKKATLVADVGGTNTLLGVMYKEKLLFRKHFKSVKLLKHIEVFVSFLKDKNIKCDNFCICAAGPLENEHIKMINNNIIIDKDEIKRRSGVKNVMLLNDVEALGYFCLNSGYFNKALVLSCGTGLGFCSVLDNNVYPSETGSSKSIYVKGYEKLLGFCENKYKRNPIIEDFVSGRGIELIFEFYSGKRFKAHDISILANKGDDDAKKSIDIFSDILAKKCQELSFSFLPEIIFIGGGIIIKNKKLIMKNFRKYYLDAYRNKKLLESVDIKTLNSKSSSLMGCYYALKRNFKRG
ncbi:MAG: ROK family protein [Nanobdellota archaeon]